MSNMAQTEEKWVSDMRGIMTAHYKQGYNDGVLAERQRIVGVATSGAVPVKAACKVKTKSEGGTTSKAPRRNPWANLSPEEREARVAKLREGQKKRWAKSRGETPENTRYPGQVAESQPVTEPAPEPIAEPAS